MDVTQIKLYNTLSRNKEDFEPIKPGEVGLYSCGPTVYLYPHIGNMRAYVFSDLLRRMFEYNDFTVKQIINITDVGHLVGDESEGEDKVEKEARAENKTAQEIADFYLQAFMTDLASLNIKTTDTIFPRATQHIAEQIELIKKLEEKGFTYQTSDGIYFNTARYPKYIELAQLDLEGQKEGARVEINSEKINPTDFALWKFSKPTEQRQQEWPSPWGVGFPGWHIECSAMSMKYLGNHFDIHTGGIDHIPVHHTNERAQSECSTGEDYVNYWMHVNFISVDGEKMAKSLGNIYRLEDLNKKGFSAMAYRYLLMTANYRKTLNFTWEALEGASNAYKKLINVLSNLKNSSEEKTGIIIPEYREEFLKCINDDLNTAEALAVIWKLLGSNEAKDEDKLATILDFDRFLGLDLLSAIDQTNIEIPVEVQELANQREEARRDKDYSRSDELRQEIGRLGYGVEDSENGPKIRKI